MENAFIAVALIGVVQFGKLVEQKNYKAAAKIVAAVVIGALAGYFDLGGITTVEAGIEAGLIGSGVYTVAQKVG